MSEALHLWAVAPAAIGTCCLAADRARVRPPEVVASVLMLLAMLDTALSGLLAPVYWAALLILAALVLAMVRRPRRRRAPRVPVAMTLHTALGLVVMAALSLVMTAHAPAAGHAHGIALAPVLLVGSGAYAVVSAALIRRMRARVDRLQISAMGASVVLMAAALL
ncbi:hypothetical protein [Microbacterium sp.]|jgi:hypothetical protein|uniref:hypothetical protein n=1 Tax=Microbacterium sp. TaxID=51671 RepID=UPI0037CA37E5